MWLILDIGENIGISQRKRTANMNEQQEKLFFFREAKLKVHMSFVMLKLTERKNVEQISLN